MSPPKRSLENLIHKSLIWRLVIAGAVLSLSLAIVVYMVNRDSIGDAVVARMEQAIEMFGEQLAISIGDSADLNPALLQAEVDRYASAPRLGVREGKFVFSAIYDLSGNQLAAYVAPEHEISDALKSKISPPSRHVMFQEDVTLEVVRTRVDVLAHLYLPLRNSISTRCRRRPG